MPKIYLIYRLEDSRKSSQQILATLTSTFGASNIKSPDYGKYVDVYQIERDVQQTDYLIVVIGRYWADIVDEGGINLLRDVYDPVHMAIATAIRAKKIIIPILVDGGSFPTRPQLPQELRGLVQVEPIKLDNDKNLKKDLKSRIEQPTMQLPAFLQKSIKTPSVSKKQPDKWRDFVRLGVLPILLVAFIVGLFVVILLPQESFSNEMQLPVTELVATVTPIVPQASPTPIMEMPSTEAPLDVQVPASSRITITRANAMQLGRIDTIDDTLGTVTETFDFTGDMDLFVFISPDLKELYIREVPVNSLIVTLSTEPDTPVAVAFSDDETLLYVLTRSGKLDVWAVVPD